MFIADSADKEYRFGDSGPKYIMKGPRMNFGIVRLVSGEDFRGHYHNVMEENFFVLEGKIDFTVDGKSYTLSEGQYIHIEPGEVHYLKNNTETPVKAAFALAPFMENDKVEV